MSRKLALKWLSFQACTKVGNVSVVSAGWVIDTKGLICVELNQLTGIAAILTYPMDIEDVQEEERMLAQRTQTEVE